MKRYPELASLSRDHNKALMLALRIERELPDAGSDAMARLYSDLLAFWSAGLLPHFRTENECLLARLVRHVPSEHELIQRTQADHLTIEALVATMRDTDGLEVRREALERFAATLREHVRWEEEVLFERTQELLEREEMRRLGADIAERATDATTPPPPARQG